MRILVLGASGFFGRHVVPRLLAGGHAVVALARRPPPASPGIEPVAAEVLAEGAMERALVGCQAAVNLVGLNHEHGSQTYERLHVQLTDRLITAAEAAGLQRVVQVSVLAARPDPLSPYHDTKYRSDERVKAAKVPWVIVRPAIVFGSDDQFTTRIAELVATRVVPLPAGGTAIHAPVDVEDVAAAIVLALTRADLVGQILPLAGPRILPYREIVAEIVAASGHGAWTPSFPVALIRIAAAMTSWLAAPPITSAQLTMLTEGMAADTSATWALLGLTPHPFAAPRSPTPSKSVA